MTKHLLVALLSISLLSCNRGVPEPIKVGFIGPLTGEAASYGIDTVNGVMMAIDELNALGGINGRQMQLIAEDGRCTGSDAASAAQKLITVDKVVAIIGGQCSGETLAAAPIAETAGIPLISPVSSSPDVTGAGDFVFRVYPSDALKTKAMAQFFLEKEFSNIAVISENTDFAIAFRDSLKRNFSEQSFVFDEIVEPGTKDFRTLMARLKDTEFDVFFPNGQTSTTIAAMMLQFRELGMPQPTVSHDVAQDASLLELAPDASEGLFAIGVPELLEDSPFGAKVAERFGGVQAAYVFIASAYDALNVLADAIATVGMEGTAIRDYLYEVKDFSGTLGRFGFDENGDIIGIPYVLYRVQDGTWVKVGDISP